MKVKRALPAAVPLEPSGPVLQAPPCPPILYIPKSPCSKLFFSIFLHFPVTIRIGISSQDFDNSVWGFSQLLETVTSVFSLLYQLPLPVGVS